MAGTMLGSYISLIFFLLFLPKQLMSFVGTRPQTPEEFNFVIVDHDGWPTWESLKRFNDPSHRLYNTDTEKIPIYVASLFKSITGYDFYSPSHVQELHELYAMEYVLRFINEASYYLEDYELRVIHSETECDAGTGLKSFIQQLSQDPVKIMLIGGYCSVVSLPVASVAHYWNLIQFSHGSGSRELSDKNLYPLFFRMLGGFSEDQVPKYLQVALRFNYKHVAILYQIDNFFPPGDTQLRYLISYSVRHTARTLGLNAPEQLEKLNFRLESMSSRCRTWGYRYKIMECNG